ncbi:MAG: SDR family NAD(P)-dependent oxidoreductase [Candidatus Thiosymbion ectosymbiont of Robbea hypermnestra]|nr:SDR family NAD(P)-dependent oxidoreductase [Candidatus Thiosymbion ectosymbiont of Robbea hypermnestra]
MKRVKRILVTGANRGIGLELVKQLAAKGHRLILGCRNPEKGKEAIRGLAGDIAVVALDVVL